MLDDLYNRQILAHAANIPLTERLSAPDATVRRESRLCGSRVTVDLALRDGAVAAYGQEVRACALGQAAASILAQHVIGLTPAELIALRDRMQAMLKAGGTPPEGAFADLAILQPAIAYPARHASIMLAFEAAAEGAQIAAGARATVGAG